VLVSKNQPNLKPNIARMNKLKTLLIAVFTLLSFLKLSAQTNDAQLWADLKLDYKLSSNASIYGQVGSRFSENISKIGMGFTELGADYELNKTWEIGASYRFYSSRKNEDLYSNRHKFNLDLSFKKSFYLLSLKLRTRAQMSFKDIYSSDDGKIPAFEWRNKFELKYKLTKKIKPFFYFECYLPLSNSEPFELTKTKYSLGIEYKINKRNSFEIYYLYQAQQHKNDPDRDFVTGISYICSF
jgi:hypothetical protein